METLPYDASDASHELASKLGGVNSDFSTEELVELDHIRIALQEAYDAGKNECVNPT